MHALTACCRTLILEVSLSTFPGSLKILLMREVDYGPLTSLIKPVDLPVGCYKPVFNLSKSVFLRSVGMSPFLSKCNNQGVVHQAGIKTDFAPCPAVAVYLSLVQNSPAATGCT